MAQPEPRWTTAAELGQVDVPPGGTTDQVLAKNSNADRDLKWADPGGEGGGSFLSANVARVDPSGDDETGEVGDLSKPFLTGQAAAEAFEAMDPIPEWPIIEFGNFNAVSEEAITTSLLKLKIMGPASWNPVAFNDDVLQVFRSLAFTEIDATVEVILENCFCPSGDIIINNGSNNCRIQLLNSYLSAIIADGTSDPPGTGNLNNLRVDGGGNSTITDIYTLGVGYISNFTNPLNVTVGDSSNCNVTNCAIDSLNSAPGEIINTELHLWNSYILGSNSAIVTAIEQQDLLIKPPTSDPEIEGVIWNNAGTLAISAGPPP